MTFPLSGLKLLDLSMNLPGPYMTWLLAVMGADVLKIENPTGGDSARTLLGTGASPFFEAVNRNKKSFSLNLKHPEGKKLFLKLLNRYDVLVEGFRPGTMERLGLGFDVVSAANPRLIQVSISGYGQEGPYRLKAGHDLNYLSLSGIAAMTGVRTGEPAIPGVQVADLAGGSLSAICGLLAAVIQREKTGKGQLVDVSMFHGALSLATMVSAGVEAGLEEPSPCKMVLNGRLPCYGLYPTKDGKYMSLAALEPAFWKNFCAAVERPDLLASSFGGNDAAAEIERIFLSRTQDEWTELFRDLDACCEPVLSLKDAVRTPLASERNMFVESDNGRFLGFPVSFSDSEICENLPAPGLGNYTREILNELGISEGESAELEAQGVVKCGLSGV